jgi:hypothetical protein
MSELPSDLQSAFIESLGKPIPFGAEQIIQADLWELEGPTVVEVRFAEGPIFENQSVRLSIKKPGRIGLSDGTFVPVVGIHDEPGLPRFVRHLVEPKGARLLVYNCYAVFQAGERLQESWTGNAGMIVTLLSESSRRYECSDNIGAFDRTNLVFDVTVLPADAPWLPSEIYN